MDALFDPDRHTPLVEIPWNEADARAAIAEIVADAVAAFDPDTLWRVHLQDAPVPDGMAGVYMGAAGVIWALDHLKREGAATYEYDFRTVLPALVARDDFGLKSGPFGAYGSLLMGDLGPMLLAMRLAPDRQIVDRIFVRAEGNSALPPLELMWGMAGSMLACVFMHAATGEARFEDLYRFQAARLLESLDRKTGVEAWTIEIYGQQMCCPGLVHGFAGNMLALIAGWTWLAPDWQRRVAEVATATLAAIALHAPERANWPMDLLDAKRPILCQICHGAPGVLTAFARAPFSTPDFERLLVEGGNLIWAAGPLAKGSNFCHGTGGNGHALLRLYERTRDPVWLDRARAFAMAAIAQCRAARAQHGRGRYSLWTGDPGLAVILWDCIRAEPAFPGLDLL